jgi:hypothetical protein
VIQILGPSIIAESGVIARANRIEPFALQLSIRYPQCAAGGGCAAGRACATGEESAAGIHSMETVRFCSGAHKKARSDRNPRSGIQIQEGGKNSGGDGSLSKFCPPCPPGFALNRTTTYPLSQDSRHVISRQKKEFGYRAGFLAGNRMEKMLLIPGGNSRPFAIQPAEDGPSTVCFWGKDKFALHLFPVLHETWDHRRRLDPTKQENQLSRRRERRMLSGGPGDHIAEDLLVTFGGREELNPHIVVDAGGRIACIVDPDNLA